MEHEGAIMPTPHRPGPAARRAIKKLGADLREARIRRNLSQDRVADRAATSRASVRRLEQGDASVSLGIVAAVMQALGLVSRLETLASPAEDEVGQILARERMPKRAYSPRRKPEAGDG